MEKDFYYVEVPRHKVKIVDALVELAKDSGRTIENDNDWSVVQKLFEFFKYEFPEDYQNVLKSVAELKQQHNYGNAIVKEGEGMVQHQMEIPQKFAEMIEAVFPDQKFDKDFVRGLSKAVPILKVASQI